MGRCLTRQIGQTILEVRFEQGGQENHTIDILTIVFDVFVGITKGRIQTGAVDGGQQLVSVGLGILPLVVADQVPLAIGAAFDVARVGYRA